VANSTDFLPQLQRPDGWRSWRLAQVDGWAARILGGGRMGVRRRAAKWSKLRARLFLCRMMRCGWAIWSRPCIRWPVWQQPLPSPLPAIRLRVSRGCLTVSTCGRARLAFEFDSGLELPGWRSAVRLRADLRVEFEFCCWRRRDPAWRQRHRQSFPKLQPLLMSFAGVAHRVFTQFWFLLHCHGQAASIDQESQPRFPSGERQGTPGQTA